MKQVDLAKRLKITPQHMNDIIKRRRRPSVDLAEKLEEATGIDRRCWVWPDQFPNPMILTPDTSHPHDGPNHNE